MLQPILYNASIFDSKPLPVNHKAVDIAALSRLDLWDVWRPLSALFVWQNLPDSFGKVQWVSYW